MDSLVPAHVLHRLISSKDVALRLGVSQATVLRAVARGLLRPALITPGGHRRLRADEAEALAVRRDDDPHGAPPLCTPAAGRLPRDRRTLLERALRRRGHHSRPETP